MPLPHAKLREITFLLLYATLEGGAEEADLVKPIAEQLKVSNKNINLARCRMREILPHLELIDQRITEVSTGYDFNRIHSVERNLLRLAVFELMQDPSIPPKVAISEAMRLGKKFSCQEAMSFINAILDQIFQAEKRSA